MSAAPHTLPASGVGALTGASAGARTPVVAARLRACGRVLRERGWLVALCPLLVIGAALAYRRIAPRRYTAQAQLLIQPASPDDALLESLPVLHQSAAPAVDVQAATSLILSREVARLAVSAGHLRLSPSAVLGDVSAAEIGQSSLVAVRAASRSASLSERLANAFATAAVANATAAMHAAIAAQLRGLRDELASTPAAQRYLPSGIGTDVDELRLLLREPNPTMLIADRASRPVAPAGPTQRSALLIGLLAGLLIGIAAAVGADALDPRLRREEQLRDALALPLLARVPRERRRARRPLLLPEELSPACREAHRSLRSRLLARAQERGRDGRVYLISGAGSGTGKTTTAINLACELARTGASVTLLECDLRRPTLARALGLSQYSSTGQVLAGVVDLSASLTTVSVGGCRLSLLVARRSAAPLAPRLSQARIDEVIARARASADFVVVDSPPLDAVADALALGRCADEILLVARVGRSRLDRLRDAVAMIEHSGALVSGLVVIGAARQSASYRAYLHDEEGGVRAGARP